jgi:hypothetical protein
VNKSNLHVENQQSVHMRFLAWAPAKTGAKKRPDPLLAGLWGPALLTHATSHDPLMAVVKVVVDAKRWLFMA